MRICLINLWDRGGMLHYTSQLANNLACLPGLQPIVVLPETAIPGQATLFEKDVILAPVNVITEISFQQLVRLPFHIWRMLRFPSVIAGLHPDVIHIVSAHVGLIYALPRLSRRFPVVSTLHDIEPHPGMDNTLRKKWEIETLIRYSKCLFVHGQALKERLLILHPEVSGENVQIIPHGNYAFFKDWAAGVREEPASILFFGRIRDYKGLPLLYEAYLRVIQSVPKARLIIAGEGSLGALKPSLESLPNCEIHNQYIPDEKVSSYFERSSIVVCPYTEASQSGVIPVAYAFKKPVVATRVGCLPESVEDGETGYLVPPNDPVALADSLISLLRDPERGHKFGENGHQKMLDELGWDMIATTTQGVYQKVV
jgi:alpha-maltose-1-phosphate synthase